MSTKYLFSALSATTGHPIRKLILIYLADASNDLGEAFRAHSRIAKECECSIATVKRHLDILFAEGHIEWENRAGKGVKLVNKYKLLDPAEMRTNGKLKAELCESSNPDDQQTSIAQSELLIAQSEPTPSSERAIVPITNLTTTTTTGRPSINDISEYVETREIKINPESFFDYYSANGWKVGRNAMKDWKAAVRTWEKRERSQPARQQERAVSTKSTTLQQDLADTSWA